MYSESPRFEQNLPSKLINKKKPTQGQTLYEHLESTQALWSAATSLIKLARFLQNVNSVRRLPDLSKISPLSLLIRRNPPKDKRFTSTWNRLRLFGVQLVRDGMNPVDTNVFNSILRMSILKVSALQRARVDSKCSSSICPWVGFFLLISLKGSFCSNRGDSG